MAKRPAGGLAGAVVRFGKTPWEVFAGDTFNQHGRGAADRSHPSTGDGDETPVNIGNHVGFVAKRDAGTMPETRRGGSKLRIMRNKTKRAPKRKGKVRPA